MKLSGLELKLRIHYSPSSRLLFLIIWAVTESHVHSKHFPRFKQLADISRTGCNRIRIKKFLMSLFDFASQSVHWEPSSNYRFRVGIFLASHEFLFYGFSEVSFMTSSCVKPRNNSNLRYGGRKLRKNTENINFSSPFPSKNIILLCFVWHEKPCRFLLRWGGWRKEACERCLKEFDEGLEGHVGKNDGKFWKDNLTIEYELRSGTGKVRSWSKSQNHK